MSDTPIKITMHPDKPRRGRPTALVTWGNPDTQRALRTLFNEQPNERLVEVFVDGNGLCGHYELVPEEVPAGDT